MDLRVFTDQLDNIGELTRVDSADWNLEIGAITELSDERNGGGLLFDRIKGYPPGYRVLTNFLGNSRCLAAAFGLPLDTSSLGLVHLLREKLQGVKQLLPVYVSDGPLLENVYREEEVDLLRLPVPKWHEYDGGRYLGTADLIINRDPKDGWVNVGTYRCQLHDKQTLGVHIEPGHHGRIIEETYWAMGKPCPIAAVFGAHPLELLPSSLAYPWGTEEYQIAGGLSGEPLRLIKGEYTGLPIPAQAEIAIEGEVPPPEVESRIEGPHGEWPGYYASGARPDTVIKVKRLMHRRDPIITGAPPLKPPAGSKLVIIIRAAKMWSELERLGIPGIRGVWIMRAGGNRYLVVVCIEQKYAGHAKQVAMATLSGVEGAFQGRFTIIVDEDIDPSNYEDVLWAVATRCDPATSMEIITGCWSAAIDPVITPEQKAKGDLTNSRAVLLAVRPYHWRKDFPKVNRASDELRARTWQKWEQVLKM